MNATRLQPPSIEGSSAAGPMPRETRVVRFERRSRTKMSDVASPSPSARLVAVDWKATQCGLWRVEPSSDGFVEAPSPWAPELLTLTRRSVPPGVRSCSPAAPLGRVHRYTSGWPLVSPPTRFVAVESNAA